MKHWLLKSEPHVWSIEHQKSRIKRYCDGVRNYQAANNLKKMKVGDLCFLILKYWQGNCGWKK